MRAPSLTRPQLAALVLGSSLGLPVAGQDDTEVPVCDPSVNAAGPCRLAAWPTDGAAALPSLFGMPDLASSVWVPDASGDAPAGGLDILGVGSVTGCVVGGRGEAGRLTPISL